MPSPSIMLFVIHTRETLHLTPDTQEEALPVVRNTGLNWAGMREAPLRMTSRRAKPRQQASKGR